MPVNLLVYPASGKFEVGPIRSYVEGRQDAVLDPLGSGAYMLTGLLGDVTLKKLRGEARLARPAQFPYSVIVEISADQMVVVQE